MSPELMVVLIFLVFFCGVLCLAIHRKGDVRTGFESPLGKFFLEAKESRKRAGVHKRMLP
jgi:hypothetical protein